MTNSPLIGCVQLNSQQNVDHNLYTIEHVIVQASSLGVKLIVLPENMLSMGNQHELSKRFETLSAQFANLARHHKLYILAGTLPCPYRPDGTTVPDSRLRQVSQLFDPSGKCIARYDKIHLFKAYVADNLESYDESLLFEPGDKLVVADCELEGNTTPIQVGLMVCFDLRFPALAQRLRGFGAQILTAPSAFTYQTGQAHWQLLLRARSLDAQCMVIGAAQGGMHRYSETKSRRTWGHAAITLANGTIAAAYASDKLDIVITKSDRTNSISTNSDISHINEKMTACYCSDTHILLIAPFERQRQTKWRQDLPIHHCHRLG